MYDQHLAIGMGLIAEYLYKLQLELLRHIVVVLDVLFH
jgi:hypothetical protein